MIDPERWAKALGLKDAGIGVNIAEIATAILHKSENSNSTSANIMRLVYTEPPSDINALLKEADAIETYAEKLELPLYASCTPNGRLVANICAFASFDETDEVIECLHKITSENRLNSTQRQ